MDVRHGGELLNEEGPDVGCPRRATIDRNEVVLLFLRRLDRLSINGVDDRPHGGVGPEHEGGGHEAVERKPFAGQDGKIERIIPELIEIGLDVLNPVQPGCMDPAALKRQYGDKLCFWGSIDEQQTLPFGTPEQVREQVLERLETVGYDGGLIEVPRILGPAG